MGINLTALGWVNGGGILACFWCCVRLLLHQPVWRQYILTTNSKEDSLADTNSLVKGNTKTQVGIQLSNFDGGMCEK